MSPSNRERGRVEGSPARCKLLGHVPSSSGQASGTRCATLAESALILSRCHTPPTEEPRRLLAKAPAQDPCHRCPLFVPSFSVWVRPASTRQTAQATWLASVWWAFELLPARFPAGSPIQRTNQGVAALSPRPVIWLATLHATLVAQADLTS
jgi:hypothetical protein